MSEGNTQTLTCAICKQSCEGKAYATDAKGRVVCRACIDKKKAARTATDTGGQDVMGALLSKSKMSNATPCPSCKSYMPADTVICAHCGYNTQTGKAATTRVIAAPKEKRAKASGGGMSLSLDPMMGVWGMALVYAGLAIGAFAMPGLAIAYLLVFILHATITSIWLWVVMIIDGDWVWVLLGFVPLIGLITTLYYIIAKLQRPAVKGHWALALLFSFVTGIMSATVLEGDPFSSAVAPPPEETRWVA